MFLTENSSCVNFFTFYFYHVWFSINCSTHVYQGSLWSLSFILEPFWATNFIHLGFVRKREHFINKNSNLIYALINELQCTWTCLMDNEIKSLIFCNNSNTYTVYYNLYKFVGEARFTQKRAFSRENKSTNVDGTALNVALFYVIHL